MTAKDKTAKAMTFKEKKKTSVILKGVNKTIIQYTYSQKL